MIRDGFKEEKKVTAKEVRKKKEMGERAYYASQIPKLQDLTRGITISNNFVAVTFGLAYAAIVFMFIVTMNTEEPFGLTKFIIWSSIAAAFVIWYFLWLFVLKPRNLKKAERYKKELERLSAASLAKMSGAYKIYGEEYIEKIKQRNALAEEKRKSEALHETPSPETTEKDGTTDENTDGND